MQLSSDFIPTGEQSAIVSAARDTKDNLLISALAGAAKTSTLVLVARALGSTAILCLAFNKKIALEMQERLPSTCVSMTLNSLGHRAWADLIGKRLSLDTKKTYRLLTEALEPLDPKEKELAYASFRDLLQAIDAGKTCGYIPTRHFPTAKRLMDDEAFFESLDEAPSKLEEDLMRSVTLASIKEAYQGTIDFNDQILLPTVFPAQFPLYPLVMVDEAQDLSALNHATLRKIAKKRLIAVGDECQSIYGFRGAHQDSMQLLQEQFHMRQLVLSTSFRCPVKVVEAARWRAPHMQWPEWAKEGVVTSLPKFNVKSFPDTAVILCRNNAPLFTMAIRLLKAGRYPQLVGNEIGSRLMKILAKFGKPSIPQTEVLEKIDEWTKAALKKYRGNPSRVHDQADCLRIFALQGRDLGDAIAYGTKLLASSGPVKLMTGHKSKGLEFETVFILDSFLLGDDQQDRNLLYVMQTRTKHSLTYIDSANFTEGDLDGL